MTRTETLRLLGSMVQTTGNLPAEARECMPEINWLAWAALAGALAKPSQHSLQIWVAVKELTPMTLQYLNGYKRTQPQLFSIVP